MLSSAGRLQLEEALAPEAASISAAPDQLLGLAPDALGHFIQDVGALMLCTQQRSRRAKHAAQIIAFPKWSR